MVCRGGRCGDSEYMYIQSLLTSSCIVVFLLLLMHELYICEYGRFWRRGTLSCRGVVHGHFGQRLCLAPPPRVLIGVTRRRPCTLRIMWLTQANILLRGSVRTLVGNQQRILFCFVNSAGQSVTPKRSCQGRVSALEYNRR